MIYIIGDSHVSVFSGTDVKDDGQRHIQPEFGTQYTIRKGQITPMNKFEQRIPYFNPIKIGSNTAYGSYGKLPIIEQVIDEYDINGSDYVFTCFGEIDISHHIGFQADKAGMLISDAIKICVDQYMKTVLYLKDAGINVGVYAPMAQSGHRNGIYRDMVFRNKMTIEFNEYLAQKCNENDIPIVDISKQMLLPDGTTDSKWFMDGHHLAQTAMPLLIDGFRRVIKEMQE